MGKVKGVLMVSKRALNQAVIVVQVYPKSNTSNSNRVTTLLLRLAVGWI